MHDPWIRRHIGLILIGTAVSAGTACAGEAARPYEIAGIQLGMSIAAVQTRYPRAVRHDHEARRYCFGRAVRLAGLSRPTLLVRREEAWLEIGFSPAALGHRVTSMRYTRIVDTDRFDMAELRDRLVGELGPYRRRLVRRKMEPAGRLIGFEWRRPQTAVFSAILHSDHADNSGHTLLTLRAANDLLGMVQAARESRIVRSTIQAFRSDCTARHDIIASTGVRE